MIFSINQVFSINLFCKPKINVLELSEDSKFITSTYTKSVTSIIKTFIKTNKIQNLKTILKVNAKYLFIDKSKQNFIIINEDVSSEYIYQQGIKSTKKRIFQTKLKFKDLQKLAIDLLIDSNTKGDEEEFEDFFRRETKEENSYKYKN